jgi:hypothetical protein
MANAEVIDTEGMEVVLATTNVLGSVNESLIAVVNTRSVETVTRDTEATIAVLDKAMEGGVRRPYRGINIKKESFATISIVQHDHETDFSTKSLLKNSSVKGETAYTSNFLINSVSETRNEKHQPVSTFGKDYVYFFGEQPRQMTFSATLLNSENFRWEEEWWYNYEEYFRGTRLASKSEIMRVRVDETVIYGYMINCSSNKDSSNPHSVNLTFTVHVTNVVSVRAEASIGSDEIAKEPGNAYGYLDFNAVGTSTLKPITIGQSSLNVREYNINQYLSQDGAGPVGRFLNEASAIASDIMNSVTSFKKDFIDFLYGRNLVIPVDAAYSEFASGNSQFAEGTENYDILQKRIQDGDKRSFIAGKVIGLEENSLKYENNIGGSYTDNYDEYPFQVHDVTSTKVELSLGSPEVDSTLAVAAHLGEVYGINPKDLVADEDGILQGDGIPKFNLAMRVMGKVSFAALNLGYSASSRAMREIGSETSEGTLMTYPLEVSFLPNIYYGNS